MQYTLLEMVQSIMDDMDSDPITSITDTDESQQVASVIKDVYFQMVSRRIIPEHQRLLQLTSAGSTAKVFMAIPSAVTKIEWIKYNKIADGADDLNFSFIDYKPPSEFINILTRRASSESETVSATDPTSSIALELIRNDAAPSYWTSFDDAYICFDSYDVAVDADGLVGSKTLCWGSVIPTDWSETDGFVPDLDHNLFPLLLAEAKSTCFVNLKQIANAKVEKQAREQKIGLMNDKHRTRQTEEGRSSPKGPNYGRR